MFTGIIESLGKVLSTQQRSSNIVYQIKSDIVAELSIDQSVSHNGVCLTVESIENQSYFVSAVDETLKVTNLADLVIGDQINLETMYTS